MLKQKKPRAQRKHTHSETEEVELSGLGGSEEGNSGWGSTSEDNVGADEDSEDDEATLTRFASSSLIIHPFGMSAKFSMTHEASIDRTLNKYNLLGENSGCDIWRGQCRKTF